MDDVKTARSVEGSAVPRASRGSIDSKSVVELVVVPLTRVTMS